MLVEKKGGCDFFNLGFTLVLNLRGLLAFSLNVTQLLLNFSFDSIWYHLLAVIKGSGLLVVVCPQIAPSVFVILFKRSQKMMEWIAQNIVSSQSFLVFGLTQEVEMIRQPPRWTDAANALNAHFQDHCKRVITFLPVSASPPLVCEGCSSK